MPNSIFNKMISNMNMYTNGVGTAHHIRIAL
jgi:hypothetical protein